MKITELRCTACNGTLKIDEKNPNRAVCEYCKSEYTIEWDNNSLGNQEAHLTQIPEPVYYTPPKRQESDGVKRALIITFLFALLASFGFVGVVVNRMHRTGRGDWQEAAGEVAAMAGKPVPSGILAEFLEKVYDKPMSQISDQEIDKIKWIEVRDTDTSAIGYSFEDPLENPSASLAWIEFAEDDFDIRDSGLSAFTGLRRISSGSSLRAGDLQELHINSVSLYCKSFDQLAEVLEYPEELRVADVEYSDFSLAGIDKFPNLERLRIDGSNLQEGKLLVNAKNLKSLTLDMYEGKFDYTVFEVMPWLEELAVISPSLKDFSFIARMPELKSLHMEDGTFLTLEPLASRPELEHLAVLDCDDLKDMSAITALSGLTSLEADLPYNCDAPDLGGLTQLKELHLKGFKQTRFLKNMTALNSLTLNNCSVSPDSGLEGLTELKTLTCTAFSASAQDYGFVTRLGALEALDLQGMVSYEDISGIFNISSLKSLNLDGMECEIRFDKIGENTTLEALSMNGIKLYKNVSVQRDGAITYVNYDDVSFNENIGFISKFGGLKELSIRENEVTDLSFAVSMGALHRIDLGNNYVTDLSPLSGLTALKTVNCEDNPISNYRVLSGSVTVIQ